MDDTIAVEAPESKNAAPVHLWIVGVLGLLWNALGATDFTLTSIRYESWIAQLPPEVIQQIDAYPAWSIVGWACGVWGAVLGSLLLLIRSRLAVPAFAVSLAGLAATTVYQLMAGIYGLTGAMLVMNLLIWASAVGLLVYAVRMRKRGVLR